MKRSFDRRQLRTGSSGQALVEYAIIIAMLSVVLVSLAFIGRGVYMALDQGGDGISCGHRACGGHR